MKVTVTPEVDGVVGELDGVWLESHFEIDLLDVKWASPRHSEHREVKGELAGLGEGTVVADEFQADAVRVTREVFIPKGGDDVAVRLKLCHDRDTPVAIGALTPVAMQGNASLTIGREAAPDWIVVRQPRYKNDLPAATRLGSEGPEFHDAQRGTPETGGVPRLERDDRPARIVSSELTVIRGGADHDAPALVVGYLPVTDQLVSTTVSLDASRSAFDRLEAVCHFDRARTERGQERVSQWVWLHGTLDAFRGIDRYTRILEEWHPTRKGGRPDTVWCSWYYYGDGFKFSELSENLAAASRMRLPIDVVQVDECWDRRWSDWQPNSAWPQDMREVAQRIRGAGYRPGIWTCPFLAEPRSNLTFSNSDWLLHNRGGEAVSFWMGRMQSYVLDPTHPEVLEWLEGLYRRLTHEWGFTYHKLDFLRAVAYDPEALFYDVTATRAEAYRRGLEAIRRGMGEDAYLLVCGGLYGPSIGLADAQRTGADVRSEWPAPPEGEGEEYGPFTIKQNALRFWMNELWDNDPDALMVRRRDTEYSYAAGLSLGKMNDDEALTSALNQYLGGGIVCFTENLTEVDKDRLLLLRHCSPSIGRAAVPVDLFDARRFPVVFDTLVQPSAKGMAPYHTLSVVNWSSQSKKLSIPLARDASLGEAEPTGRFFVAAFRTGNVTGPLAAGETVDIGTVPPHGCEVIKVMHVRPERPAVLWTNGHFSMGGREIVEWRELEDAVELTVDWRWNAPLVIKLLPPEGTRFVAGDTIRVDGPLTDPQTFRMEWETA